MRTAAILLITSVDGESTFSKGVHDIEVRCDRRTDRITGHRSHPLPLEGRVFVRALIETGVIF
jgi:hypothetical protein